MTMRTLTGWIALITAIALAIGGGAITDDLRTLIGARADQVVAGARIVAAVCAAATGSILARRGGPDAPPRESPEPTADERFDRWQDGPHA